MNKKLLSLLGVIIIVIGAIIYYTNIQVKENTTSPDTQTSSTVSENSATSQISSVISDTSSIPPESATQYRFRNQNLLNQHFEKHGKDMGFASVSEYEQAADRVIKNPNALHKTEAEDGDYVYYVESTNEFVILSKDGYIRTYFLPDAGIAYYNRQ